MSTPVVNIFDVGDYEEQVRGAAELLRGGKLVVLPTETVYGTAALLTHAAARERLKAFRSGGDEKPFTIHLARRELAARFLGETEEFEQRLMRKLWPGPVALMFEVPPERRTAVAAELNLPETELYDGSTITLRCPDHIVATDVLVGVDGPVVLTRADAGASHSPSTPNPFPGQLDGKVDLILDAGPTRYSKPSTIVKVGAEKYEI